MYVVSRIHSFFCGESCPRAGVNKLSVKSQMVNILALAGHRISVLKDTSVAQKLPQISK